MESKLPEHIRLAGLTVLIAVERLDPGSMKRMMTGLQEQSEHWQHDLPDLVSFLRMRAVRLLRLSKQLSDWVDWKREIVGKVDNGTRLPTDVLAGSGDSHAALEGSH